MCSVVSQNIAEVHLLHNIDLAQDIKNTVLFR